MILTRSEPPALLNGPPRADLWIPAGSGLCEYQQLFSEWWDFPMPLTRLIRPCHPKNLSVNHLYPIEFKPVWVTCAF